MDGVIGVTGGAEEVLRELESNNGENDSVFPRRTLGVGRTIGVRDGEGPG